MIWSDLTFSPLLRRLSRLPVCNRLCSTLPPWCDTAFLTSPFFSNLLSTFPPKKKTIEALPPLFWSFLFSEWAPEFNNLTFFSSYFFPSYFFLSLSGRKHVNNGLYRFRQGEGVWVGVFLFMCSCLCEAQTFWCDGELMFVVQAHWSGGLSVWLLLKSTIRMFDEACLKSTSTTSFSLITWNRVYLRELEQEDGKHPVSNTFLKALP